MSTKIENLFTQSDNELEEFGVISVETSDALTAALLSDPMEFKRVVLLRAEQIAYFEALIKLSQSLELAQ